MISIDYFSDVLCVWAYGGQIRLDELRQTFAGQIRVRHRFVPLFADTRGRIGEGWSERGGFDGFGGHMQEVCSQWPHTRLDPRAWTRCRPASCVPAHLFLAAAALALDADDDASAENVLDRLAWRVRAAFFEHAADIARMDVLLDLLEPGDPTPAAIQQRVGIGEAHAALYRDEQLMKTYGVMGSPTYVFNEGRQLLYGNVGYRIIEANVRELLDRTHVDGAPSWC